MDNIKTFEQLFENESQHTVRFKRWTGVIEKGQYGNGRIALSLEDTKKGETILVATINVPEEKIEKDEVIIKDYSENEGILDILIHAGIISKPVRIIETGMITAPVCKLLI